MYMTFNYAHAASQDAIIMIMGLCFCMVEATTT
jgi:hypothetical protein